MVMILPLLLGAASIAGPAIASHLGQRSANKTNLAIAREQMGFQERMSSTAYQRSMADMRASGLNPMLAYQQGGASSPGGASATMQDAIGPAVSSAQEARELSRRLKQIEAETSLTVDREWSQLQDRAESRARQDLTHQQSDLAKTQKKIFELQLPALENSAKVESSQLGKNAAVLDRIRQAVLGGKGFLNPIGR